MLARPLHRTRQFFGALRPSVRESEVAEVEALLGPQLMTLFVSMARRDQRHCIDVCRRIREAGCEESNVLTAALLHDAGKGALSGAHVNLWHRVAHVVLEIGPPSLDQRARARSPGLAALRDHAERGAVLAEAFGAPVEVVRLLREMEREDPSDPRAALLKASDEAS